MIGSTKEIYIDQMPKKAIKVYVTESEYEYIRRVSEVLEMSMSELMLQFTMNYIDNSDINNEELINDISNQ